MLDAYEASKQMFTFGGLVSFYEFLILINFKAKMPDDIFFPNLPEEIAAMKMKVQKLKYLKFGNEKIGYGLFIEEEEKLPERTMEKFSGSNSLKGGLIPKKKWIERINNLNVDSNFLEKYV